MVLPLLWAAACGHPSSAPVAAPRPAEAASQTPAGACPAGSTRASHGVCVPDSWHCSPLFYQGGVADGCDCGCGERDPDCAMPGVQAWCYGAGMPKAVSNCAACQTP